MQVNIKNTPISCIGSYYEIQWHPASHFEPEGLYLCSVISKLKMVLIEPTYHQKPVPYQSKMLFTELVLETDHGNLRICFETKDILRFKGEGVGVRLTNYVETDQYHTHYARYQESGKRILFNAMNSRVYAMLTALDGKFLLDAPWVGDMMPYIGAHHINMDSIPFEKGGNTEFVMEMTENSHWETSEYLESYDEALSNMQSSLEQWLAKIPTVKKEYEEKAKLAAYIMWTLVVSPKERFTKSVTVTGLMGFQQMWGWDNLFEALALNYFDPSIAWNDVTIKFDYLTEKGEQPQTLSTRTCFYEYPPRPLEGWTMELMEHNKEFTQEEIAYFYPLLAKNTDWWFKYRSEDGFICQYWHGNDSGADNATVFDETPWIESPDLNTYLVLQCDALARMADKLGKADEAKKWLDKADALAAKIIEYFWHDGEFVVRRADNKKIIHSTCLITYLPLLLGKRLPQDIISKLVKDLTSEGAFVTPWGVTSEKQNSTLFSARGYWRGLIWPSWNMLIIDGLKRCGQEELAIDLAKKFCDNCLEHGFIENYNPINGSASGLGAYSWAAASYLKLVCEYIK